MCSRTNVLAFSQSVVAEFATWIAGDSGHVIQSDWRPSRQILGELRWNGSVASIYYTHSGLEPLAHECFVSSFIQQLDKGQLRGTGRRTPFPYNMQEVLADAALRFAQQDMTLVFVPQRRWVEPFGCRLMKAIQLRDALARRNGGQFNLPVSAEGQALLKECIAVAEETVGSGAKVTQFLRAGFVVHHAGIPQKLRLKLEQLVRQQAVKLVVATTTLAQGVNFPIRTVLVQGLHLGKDESLTQLDFWNICGRAGRGRLLQPGRSRSGPADDHQSPQQCHSLHASERGGRSGGWRCG